MTKITSLLILLFLNVITYGQQKLYIELVSHNEENDPVLYNADQAGYLEKRRYIKLMADYIQYMDARWNFQSDWRFVQAVQFFDVGSVTNSTAGKNLLKWMQEDKGGTIEIDCHAHQTRYNYADVAYLHSLLDVVPSGNVGGYVTDTVMNLNMPGNNWTDMQDSLRGFRYPLFRFLFSTLWGGNNASGGGPGHGDENENPYYGMLKPDTLGNIFSHNTERRLVNLFSGCNYLVTDTSSVTDIINEIKIQAVRVSNGTYPGGVVYYTKIMTNVRDINRQMLIRLKRIIDTVDAMHHRNELEWATISEVCNEWNETDIDYWKCDSISGTGITQSMVNDNTFKESEAIKLAIYPNPGNGVIYFNRPPIEGIAFIYSSTGKLLGQWKTPKQIDIRSFGKGIYYLVYLQNDQLKFNTKIIYQ